MKTTLAVKAIVKRGRTCFLVDMRGTGGGRKFFSTETAAERFRAKMQRAVNESGEAAHDWTEADRAELTVARKILGGVSVVEAATFYAKHHSVVEKKTMAEALKICVAEKEKSGRRGNYTKKIESVIGSLCEASPKHCHEVTQEDVSGWLEKSGWKVGTKKYALQDARTFFRYCLRKGWCKVNPCDAIEQFTLDDRPPGILTVDECARLMAAARSDFPDLVGYFTLALFAGIRPEELQKMDWKNVDVERGFVEVPSSASKTRRRRIVKLEPNACAWLGICAQSGRFENWRRQFRRCRDEAKVNWSDDCLRHSYASYHLAAFGSADKTATEMGHYNTTMLFRHYRELVSPEDAAKFWALAP
jgi:integrase